MPLMLASRAVPRCTECLRNYAFGGFHEARSALGGIQQVRGKKKSTKGPPTVPVRLLKDMPTFGKKGNLVPIPVGRMRNAWFPSGIAEYVTYPELRTLRANKTLVERDLNFGVMMPQEEEDTSTEIEAGPPQRPARTSRASEIEKISSERSVQLVEIFVGQRLDFHRQPITEATDKSEAEPAPLNKRTRRSNTASDGSSATDDLLAARSEAVEEAKRKEAHQAIYGSVSTHDVLMAVRAAMANNDESARVLIDEEDITFKRDEHEGVDDATRVKHLGTYTVEIKVKGAEKVVERTVRVRAQEP